MKTKLITALRTTANALEQGTFFYKWTENSSCNCGALFCALTGKSAAELQAITPKRIDNSKSGATWTTLIGQHCPITGVPINELFRELISHGLTPGDMVNLEFLSDEAVVRRTRILEAKRHWWQRELTELDCENEDHVIAYMRAWADLLTEEGAMDVAAPETQRAQVS